MPSSGREPLLQYEVTGAICRVVTPKEERYPSPFTKQNVQGLRLYVGSPHPQKRKEIQALLQRDYRKKKLRSKYKIKCYLLCFHQLSDQQRHYSEAMILN